MLVVVPTLERKVRGELTVSVRDRPATWANHTNLKKKEPCDGTKVQFTQRRKEVDEPLKQSQFGREMYGVRRLKERKS